MRLLFIIDSLGAGGAERSLQEMLPHFEAAGMDVHVACFRRPAEGVEALVLGRHPVTFVAARGEGRLTQIQRLRQLIREARIDVVHTSLFEADVFGRTATAGTGTAVVTSLVNMPYEVARRKHDRNVNGGKLLAVRGLEALTGHLFADRFHAITDAVRQNAHRRYGFPLGRMDVVYRGRDPERLGRRSAARRDRVRTALGLSHEEPLILTAGRQEFQKGQVHLIRALGRMKTPSRLIVAGRPGSATGSLEAAVGDAGLEARVTFLGYRDDVPDLMAAADVFALPSLWEGLGCVVLEAMALELPLVASDLAPVREVTEDGAVARLVPATDESALAEALDAHFAAPEQARAQVARARELFESRYTVAESARGMMDIFARALEARRAAA